MMARKKPLRKQLFTCVNINERNEDMTPEEIKHLDYIQSAITRMSTNQFQIKGWMITIDTAILTIFANSFKVDDGPNPYFLLIALFPNILLWILDSKFLSTERSLRKIYTEVAEQKGTVKLFSIPARDFNKGFSSIFKCMMSISNVIVYLFSSVGFLIAFLYFFISQKA